MKISIHFAPGPGMDLVPTLASSLFFHLLVLFSLPFLPSFLPSGSAPPATYVVDLVELPPLAEPGGAAGGAAGPEPAAAPAPPPERDTEPPPPEPEPAVPEPAKPEPEPEPAKKKKPQDKPPVRKEVVRVPQPAPRETPPAEPADATGSAGAAEPSGPDTGPAGAETGTGPGGGLGLPGAAGAPGFDDASFQYAYYATRMVNILRSQWNKPIRPPGASGTLRAVVYFVIGRNGTILRSELEESSGYPALDMSALRAVRETRRMPPLPLQYDRDSLGVHFFFELKPEEPAP